MCEAVCIFLDDKWQNGKLIEVQKDHVVYSLSGDPEQYIMTKDEAYSIIRSRKIVTSTGKGEAYTGSNPLIFGPAGVGLYGKRITERKDRPGIYRVHVKYKPQKSAKVLNLKINLGKHVRYVALTCLFCFVCFVFLHVARLLYFN